MANLPSSDRARANGNVEGSPAEKVRALHLLVGECPPVVSDDSSAVRARLDRAACRDTLAAARDVRARARDRAAELYDAVFGEDDAAVLNRVRAAHDRDEAAQDREEAARERLRALVDREALAREVARRPSSSRR